MNSFHMSNGLYINHRTLEFISSSHHLFSPLVCYHSERLGSPWHYGWPHCWDQHQADSPGHFGGILGPALHHNHPLPVESVKKRKRKDKSAGNIRETFSILKEKTWVPYI